MPDTVAKRPEVARSRGVAFEGAHLAAILALLDLLCLGVAFAISYHAANQLAPYPAKLWKASDGAFCISLLYLTLASGGYARPNPGKPISQITRILVNGMTVATIEWIAITLFGEDSKFDWPMNGPINIVSLGALMMCAVRILMHSLLNHAANAGLISRNVAVVGAGRHGRQLLEALKRNREPWTVVIGFFDDRKGRRDDPAADLELSGTVDDLIEEARHIRIDEVVIALPWGAERRLRAIFDRLKVIPANVRLAPDMIGLDFLEAGFDRIDGVPVYNIFTTPISGWGALLKRLEDLILGSVITVLLSPLMLAVAAAIKFDSPGPVFFRQRRYGYNNKLIHVLKFRSMYHDMRDEAAVRLTSRDDPRVTRVGRFIRRTSIDELPQLFNVLAGQMSLVGPRPHPVQAKAGGKLYRDIAAEYAVRHKIKPGITGWAQVMGWRGETDTEEKLLKRVEHDFYYMENWSIFMDIEILFRTLGVLTGREAY
jgi:Undecaprenyl-phosphate glucose phosphotransferase